MNEIAEFVAKRQAGSVKVGKLTVAYEPETFNRRGRMVTRAGFSTRVEKSNTTGWYPAMKSDEKIVRYLLEDLEDAK